VKASHREFAFALIGDGDPLAVAGPGNAPEVVGLHADGSDEKFVENYRKIKAAKITRGSIWRFRAYRDPDEQAATALKYLRQALQAEGKTDLSADLPMAIAIEDDSFQPGQKPDEIATRLERFFGLVRRAMVKAPLIYTKRERWNQRMIDPTGWTARDSIASGASLWVQDWTEGAAFPRIPVSWIPLQGGLAQYDGACGGANKTKCGAGLRCDLILQSVPADQTRANVDRRVGLCSGSATPQAAVLASRRPFMFWQYAPDARVDGIPSVDVYASRFYGSLLDLHLWGNFPPPVVGKP
jgi:hypothetical protein